MIAEDDVALEVFWVFYVIVPLRFFDIVSFIVGGVGQFVRVVDPDVGLSEISAELLVFLCLLLGIRDTSVGWSRCISVVAVSGGVSHFVTYLAHQFGVVFGLDVLGVGGLGWLLLVVVGCFVLCFLTEALTAFGPFVAGDSTVAALSVKVSFCLTVLGWLGVRWLRCCCIGRWRTDLVECLWCRSWYELSILASSLDECPWFLHGRIVFPSHG